VGYNTLVQELKRLGLAVFVAGFYFAGVYFAIAALLPEWAIHCAYLASMGAVAVYIILALAEKDEEGMPAGLLYTLPFICFAAGIVWWILRFFWG